MRCGRVAAACSDGRMTIASHTDRFRGCTHISATIPSPRPAVSSLHLVAYAPFQTILKKIFPGDMTGSPIVMFGRYKCKKNVGDKNLKSLKTWTNKCLKHDKTFTMCQWQQHGLQLETMCGWLTRQVKLEMRGKAQCIAHPALQCRPPASSSEPKRAALWYGRRWIYPSAEWYLLYTVKQH